MKLFGQTIHRSLSAYREAMGLKGVKWAERYEVSELLRAAYADATQLELQQIVGIFENGYGLQVFDAKNMYDLCRDWYGATSYPFEVKTQEQQFYSVKDGVIAKMSLNLEEFNLCLQNSKAIKFRADINAPKYVRWKKFLSCAFTCGDDILRIQQNINHWKKHGVFLDALNPTAQEDYQKVIEGKPQSPAAPTVEQKTEELVSKIDDVVNHPSHYTSGKVECIDCIESATMNLNGFEGFCTGNAIKYLYRWKMKGGKQDLSKAQWYIKKLLGETA